MSNPERNTTLNTRQPWFWFAMAPLILVFFMGFSMLYLSIQSSDGVVVDNFYKDGLAIKTRYEQDALARSLSLSAQLAVTGNQISLQLTGDLTPYPAELILHFVYPTRSSRDLEVRLIATDNGYAGALPATLSGRYQLMVSPEGIPEGGSVWRLHGETHFPMSQALELLPK